MFITNKPELSLPEWVMTSIYCTCSVQFPSSHCLISCWRCLNC